VYYTDIGDDMVKCNQIVGVVFQRQKGNGGMHLRKFICLLTCLLFIVGGAATIYAQVETPVFLTDTEKEYIRTKGPIRMVVDPDWYPYEKLDEDGLHSGISADLTALISRRTGLQFEIVKTTNWEESLQIAKSGKADIISFLNKTKERSQWLLFTEPCFVDPNVLITREKHDYIPNLARLTGETMVLPEGTSIEERLRKDFPNLRIMTVKSEADALAYVDGKKADMTLRSLTMAAYVIKKDGYFNLKIAGEIPSYTNQLRMGITKEDFVLQSILNKGIASITPQEVQTAINNHISIKFMKGFDYKWFGIIFGIFSFVLVSSLFWLSRIQRLNKHLKQRQEELILLSEKLTNSEARYRMLASELESKNILLQEAASVDFLSGLKNRYSFNLRVEEEIERATRYGTALSLLMIDMDHFKRINDTYGHNAGDDVIRKVSQTLQKTVRKADLLARWGGEEFVVLLPEAAMDEAIIAGEKLRKEVAKLEHFEGVTVTVSIGVSTWNASDAVESWLKRADKGLYQAKQEGRNRVCVGI